MGGKKGLIICEQNLDNLPIVERGQVGKIFFIQFPPFFFKVFKIIANWDLARLTECNLRTYVIINFFTGITQLLEKSDFLFLPVCFHSVKNFG